VFEFNAPSKDRPSDIQRATGGLVLIVSPCCATPFEPAKPAPAWFGWVTSSTAVAVTTVICQIVRALVALYTPRPAMS